MQNTLSVINLSAIQSNAKAVKKMIGSTNLFAVVKADAYGHGAERVAIELEPFVDGFCVAIMDEGVALRLSGINKPILVFAPPLCQGDVLKAQFYGLQVTVNSLATAKLIGNLPCHIKVNTGMNRYGCDLAELESLLPCLEREQIRGVYSHLYASESQAESCKQLQLFNSARGMVKGKNPSAIAHISASGGILLGMEYHQDACRCGIMLYGYSPNDKHVPSLKRALKVYAPIAQTTNCVGGGIGYNIADKCYKKLTTLRCGYADGFVRTVPLGEKNLCMDACICNHSGAIKNNNFLNCYGNMPQRIINGQPYVRVFDDATSYAKRCKTIAYEVLCNVTKRSTKIYERTTEI